MCLNHVRQLFADEPYVIKEKLSEGTYGEIYKIVHKKSNKEFALKVLDLSHLSKYKKMHEVNA